MKREKTPKLIITFPTTTAAMAMDSLCDPALGRLIPIPGEIHGGCGLAWCSKPDNETILIELMTKNNIAYQEKQIIELY